MSMASVFGSYEARYRAEVEAATWGHLAPQPGVNYNMTLLFANPSYGSELALIRMEVEGLEDSPWLAQDVYEFIGDKADEHGKVYEFKGTYRKFKNGNCRFSGRTQVLL